MFPIAPRVREKCCGLRGWVQHLSARVAIYSRFEGGLPEAEAEEVHGGSSEAVHVVTPFPMVMPVITVIGSGDTFTVTWKAQYPRGDEYYTISILQLKEGKILKETLYWASPSEAPEWRREFVEQITD